MSFYWDSDQTSYWSYVILKQTNTYDEIIYYIPQVNWTVNILDLANTSCRWKRALRSSAYVVLQYLNTVSVRQGWEGGRRRRWHLSHDSSHSATSRAHHNESRADPNPGQTQRGTHQGQKRSREETTEREEWDVKQRKVGGGDIFTAAGVRDQWERSCILHF